MSRASHHKPRPWLPIVIALTVAHPQLAAAQDEEADDEGIAYQESDDEQADRVAPNKQAPDKEVAADTSEARKKQESKQGVRDQKEAEPFLDQANRDTASGRVFLGSRATRYIAPKTPVPVTVLTSSDLANFHGPSLLALASLRGLGRDRVLVLVNGKRRHQSAQIDIDREVGRGESGTDLNAIPISAIERVEILRDGATALYGPNAVGGVINIVLKERRGLEVETTAGNYYDHDGNALLGLDRISAGVNGGFALGDKGFLNLTLEVRDRGETNRAGIAYAQSTTDGIFRSGGLGGGIWWQDDGTCLPDPFDPDVIPPCKPVRRLRIGNADGQDYYAFYNGAYDFSDAVTLYSFGGLSRRIGNTGAGLFLGRNNGRVPAELYPDGYLPNLETTIDDMSGTLGLRYAFGGPWELDASATYGRSRFNYFVSHSANVSFYYEINPATGDIYAQTPTSANAGQLINTETTINLDLKTRFDVLEALNLAGGVEFRADNYQIKRGDYVSYGYARNTPFDPANPIYNTSSLPLQEPVVGGIQGFPGFGPDAEVNGDRLAWGAYLEADQQLTKAWLLGLAGRFESVQFTEESVVGRVATRLELADFLALRASASNGSRSPDIQKIYFSQRLTALLPQGLTETITVGDAHALRDVFGIGQLRPEKSVGGSAGFVVAPKPSGATRSLTLTVDAFVIQINDRILLSDSVTGQVPPDPPGLTTTPGRQRFEELLAENNLGAAQFFVNAADTTTQGLDVTAGWGFGLGGGLGMHLSGALNYSETKIRDSNPASTLVDQYDLFGPIQQTRLEKGEPHYTATLAHVTSFEPLAFRVALNYYGAVTGKAFMNYTDEKTWSGKWLTDASISYAPIPKLVVTVGGNNIFDVYPDEWGAVGREYAEIGYTYGRETFPFGLNGGFYYLNARYRL